jgi:hypothetical protein
VSLLLSFLSRYGIWVAGFALVGILIAGARHVVYQEGYADAEAEYKEILLLRDNADMEAKLAATAAAARINMLTTQVSIDQALIAAQKARKREVQYVEVVKWRTKYEKNPDAGKCVVPDEFVSVLDATGKDDSDMPEDAGAASTVADGTGRVSDIELLQYSTDVKMMCLKWRDQLIGWQEWSRGIQRISNGAPK